MPADSHIGQPALEPSASPVAVAADAELVSPPTVQSSGWSRLPRELRETVVDDVGRIIEDEGRQSEIYSLEPVAVGFFETEAARRDDLHQARVEKRRALERLSAVNRDFHSLSVPHFWRSIALVHENMCIERRLLDILPARAMHVRLFTGKVGCVSLGTLGEEDRIEEHEIAMRALRSCKNVRLVDLDFEYCDFPDFEMPAVEYLALRGFTYIITFDLYPGFANLTSLKLADNEDGSHGSDFLGHVVLLSSLKHLFIDTHIGDSFFEEALDLSADGQAVARLESLELQSSGTTISYDPLHAFVTKFSSSLACLRLDFPPEPRPTVGHLVTLLHAHPATLERVHIASATSLSDYDDLSFACPALGVDHWIKDPEE
ncbi:hypothetical protein JCM3775_003789 [Rhodotorula graminis]